MIELLTSDCTDASYPKLYPFSQIMVCLPIIMCKWIGIYPTIDIDVTELSCIINAAKMNGFNFEDTVIYHYK